MTWCYRLCFPDGLHVAAPGFGEESASIIVRSDTLFGAVCSAARLLFGEAQAATLLEDDAVVLSSAFPFYKDTLFFPRPRTFVPHIPDYPTQKAFKKVNFVSQQHFEAILQGGKPGFQPEHTVNGCWSHQGFGGIESLWKMIERPRVMVDRVTHESRLFHFSEMHFHQDTGLFFLAQFRDDAIRETFTAAVNLLGDEGLGADRSAGKGWFTVDPPAAFSLAQPAIMQHCILLSLYSPTPDEQQVFRPKASCYNLETRQGWVTAPGGGTLRRSPLRMFSEGSVLAFSDTRLPSGQTPCVLQQKDHAELRHDIFRYGKAFAFPIQLPEVSS